MSFDAYVRELGYRRAGEWTLMERATETASVDGDGERHSKLTRWSIVVHDDTVDGRGTARVELGANELEAVGRAVKLARATIGPAWATRPPSAPAMVNVYDKALDKQPLLDAAREIAGSVAITDVRVRTSKGLEAKWRESHYRVQAMVGDFTVMREARTRDELGWRLARADAEADAAQLAQATAATGGACAVVLGADALLHDGGYGLWAPFVAQADAVRARRGLARYRVGMAIAENSDLSIASDGALDFGLYSARLDDEGSAIRKFALVDRGVAVGLAMRAREASLLNADPNGGVRNLIVAPGTWNDAVPAGRVVEVRRLSAAAIDPFTGEARLELALSLEHADGASRPIAGGSLRLDLISALALARRSSVAIRRGPYVGPRAVLIANAELIA